MTGRDRMLGRIRESLGPERASLGEWSATGAAVPAPSFAENLRTLGGIVHEVADLEEAHQKIQQIVAGRSFASAGSELAHVEYGISAADFALADTGSLVFFSEPRLTSLLPPRHITIVGRSKILSGLEELFERVPKPADQSSYMAIVTGPSRTADIEMRLVRGVHGPGEVTVIIVNGM